MTKEEAKKIISIGWLAPCPECGAKELAVKTSRIDGKLNDCDDVVCFCGNYGYIDVYDYCAFVCWEEG